MPQVLHVLNADRSLDQWVERIERAFSRSTGLVESYIPLGNIDVVVYNDPDYVVPELGISGLCTSSRRLYIPLDVGHHDLGDMFEIRFQAFLAHELHHCARRAGPGYADTLAQALVTEGLACCFEAELPGGHVPMYATRIPDKRLAELWQRATPELNLPLRGWGEWFFGEREPDIPMHAGYCLGYEIVRRWLSRTGQSASSAYSIQAAQIVTEA